MKYCTHCGKEVLDEAVICPGCGCPLDRQVEKASNIKTIAKIFMIIGTVVNSIYGLIIPLAWCLPMTLSFCKKVKKNEKISTGFKVCILLFVNTIAGIVLLCDKD